MEAPPIVPASPPVPSSPVSTGVSDGLGGIVGAGPSEVGSCATGGTTGSGVVVGSGSGA